MKRTPDAIPCSRTQAKRVARGGTNDIERPQGSSYGNHQHTLNRQAQEGARLRAVPIERPAAVTSRRNHKRKPAGAQKKNNKKSRYLKDPMLITSRPVKKISIYHNRPLSTTRTAGNGEHVGDNVRYDNIRNFIKNAIVIFYYFSFGPRT